MRRDLTLMAVVWALLTAASLAVSYFVIRTVSFPTSGAAENHIIDDAFMVLTYFAAPVFGLVIAVLFVALLRFRSPGPGEDGPPLRGEGTVPRVWFAVTTLLAVVLIIYPGLTGLFAIRRHAPPDLTINVSGQMWQWNVEYAGIGVKVAGGQELLLPVDRHVQVNITSKDVLHSFWVPAFRQRMDAVPGHTTTLHITPDRLGDPADSAYRLQCSQLCGVGHAYMQMHVRVVSQDDFNAWVTSQQKSVEAK
jgi:cytochrome c oxidase subunit 2